MATRSANVMARVEPDIKEQAETIMNRLGLSASSVINALYRQIIYKNGLPFSLTLPVGIPARDTMSDEEFNAMMAHSLAQAKAGEGLSLDDAFAALESSIGV